MVKLCMESRMMSFCMYVHQGWLKSVIVTIPSEERFVPLFRSFIEKQPEAMQKHFLLVIPRIDGVPLRTEGLFLMKEMGGLCLSPPAYLNSLSEAQRAKSALLISQSCCVLSCLKPGLGHPSVKRSVKHMDKMNISPPAHLSHSGS